VVEIWLHSDEPTIHYQQFLSFHIVIYDVSKHKEFHNEEVKSFIKSLSKINYEEEGEITKALKTTFGDQLQSASFKKILINYGTHFDVICAHEKLRKQFKCLAEHLNSNYTNLKEIDIHVLMKQRPVLILIYGTSGSGKSTMSRRISTMYGIPNVLSTDTVRKQMRLKTSKESDPLLHASTFETGDFLSENDYKRIKACMKVNQKDPEDALIDPEVLKEMSCVKGYEYQCEIIEDTLIHEIDQICQKGESLVVEGVHLSESVCSRLYEKYEYCIPFMIYVNDADEHKLRFGSRCDNGSIDPSKNRYVKNFRYIRAIQKSIVQHPFTSKYIKLPNDDAKKTLGLVITCIRKYVKKLMKLNYLQRMNLV